MSLLMAKPTLTYHGSVDWQPHQKNLYPEPVSVNCPSSASLVSLSVAMLTLFLASSLVTNTVPLSGWLVIGLSES